MFGCQTHSRGLGSASVYLTASCLRRSWDWDWEVEENWCQRRRKEKSTLGLILSISLSAETAFWSNRSWVSAVQTGHTRQMVPKKDASRMFQTTSQWMHLITWKILQSLSQCMLLQAHSEWNCLLAVPMRPRRSSTDLRQMRSCCGSSLLTAFPTHLDQSGSVDFLGSWQRGFANEVQLPQVQSSICTDARWPEAARSPEPETGMHGCRRVIMLRNQNT